MREDETNVERNVRRAFWVAGLLGAVAAVLFVVAIALESGKAAGVGGVLFGVAVITAGVTAVFADENGY